MVRGLLIQMNRMHGDCGEESVYFSGFGRVPVRAFGAMRGGTVDERGTIIRIDVEGCGSEGTCRCRVDCGIIIEQVAKGAVWTGVTIAKEENTTRGSWTT